MTEQLVVAGRWQSLIPGNQWSDLEYDGRMPRGCWSASWRMDPGDRGIYRGQLVDIYDGTGPVWAGSIASIDPLTGEYTADGATREAEKRLALDGGGAANNVPGTATDAAVGRGMSWTGRTIASSFAGTAAPVTIASLDSGPIYLQQLLDAGAEQEGHYWWVDADRWMWMQPGGRQPTAPTGPDWFITPGYVVPGVDDEDYANYLAGRYFDSGTSSYQTALVQDSTVPWGGAEKAVSLIGRGSMTAAKAATTMANILARDGARLAVVGSVEVDASNLSNAGGVPADVVLITEGQMVRALGVFADAVSLVPYLDFVIGEVRHVVGETSVVLQPINRAAVDFQSILEKGLS